jgi:hypothetical protein
VRRDPRQQLPAAGRPAAGHPHDEHQRRLRPFSIRRGWLAPAVKVSAAYGNAAIWPGDTLGISPLPGGRISLTWGSATGTARQSAIYASVVTI